MSLILVPVWLLLQVQPGNDAEPVHAGNPIYAEAIQSGFHADGATIRFPGPILKDGFDATQQHAALLKLSGSESALADLLRDSVTAPFLLKVRDQKTTDATVRIVDLWFVVRGDMGSLDPVEVASQASGKAVEAGNMRFESRILSDDELKPRGRSSRRGRDLARWFVHLEGRLLDRIAVEATNEAVATRTEESMVIAGRTDPVFDSDPDACEPLADDRTGRSGRIRAPVPRGLELCQDQPPEAAPGVLAGRVPRGLQRAGGMVPGCSHPPLEVRTDRPGPDSKAPPRIAQEPPEVRCTSA